MKQTLEKIASFAYSCVALSMVILMFIVFHKEDTAQRQQRIHEIIVRADQDAQRRAEQRYFAEHDFYGPATLKVKFYPCIVTSAYQRVFIESEADSTQWTTSTADTLRVRRHR